MKFLLDMGLSLRSAHYLREQGHDAIHLAEQQLQRSSDKDVVAKARAEGRVILTHDLDFGTIMAASGEELPSIVIFRLADMRPENVNDHLDELLNHYSDPMTGGSVISVSEGSVRVRILPI